jgi:hypothetical protein
MKDHWKTQPRVPTGSEDGGQWTDEQLTTIEMEARKAAFSEVEFAKGVRAAKDLGGQIPQKYVNEAEKILRNNGLMPKTIDVNKLTKDDILKYYTKNAPVVGDRFNISKGGYAELAKITPALTGGISLEFVFFGNKKSYNFTVRKGGSQ